MMLDGLSKILLDLLQEIEGTSAKLYEAYAKRFPSQASLWNRMSQEETVHANWVQTIRLEVERNKAIINRDILRLEDLKKLAKKLQDALGQAFRPEMQHEDALRIAAEIEHTALEQPFSKVFASVDPKVQKLLENFDRENQNHAADLKDRAKRLGARPKPVVKPRNR